MAAAITASMLASTGPAQAVSRSASGGAPAPSSATAGRVFSSSFESISDFDGFYIVPPNQYGTASHEQSTEQIRTGTYSHKGWIYGANPPPPPDTNHRGYPTVQFHKMAGGSFVCPCTVRFYAWLEMPLDEPGEWFSFATLARSPSDSAWDAVIVNVSAANPAPGTVAGGVLHLMHAPSAGLREPAFQTSTILFPTQQWVEIEIYIDLDPVNGQAIVWQDGQMVSAAPVTGASGKLEQAHFGLYADAHVASGVVYNDDLEITEAATGAGADNDGDGVADAEDNCRAVPTSGQTDGDADALGDACEPTFATNAADPDSDDDGCADGREVRVLTYTPQQGGDRAPLSEWDFFDVPAPAGPATGADGKLILAASAAGNAAVTLQDVSVILAYVGRTAANPAYAQDNNGDGQPDGQQLDRTPSSTPGKLWRSRAPSGAVTLQDASVALAQVGHSCVPPP